MVWKGTEKKIIMLLKVRCSQPERNSLGKEERLSATCLHLPLYRYISWVANLSFKVQYFKSLWSDKLSWKNCLLILAAPGTKPLASSLHTELLNSIRLQCYETVSHFLLVQHSYLLLPICFHKNHVKHSRKLLCSVLSCNFVPTITRDIVNRLIKSKRFFLYITWKDFAA